MRQYIRNTFNAAKDGMSINGMDSREMEAEVAKAQEGEGQDYIAVYLGPVVS